MSRESWLTEDLARKVTRAAVRAPSVLNTQPWLFEVRSDRVELYGDPDRRLPVSDPDARQLVMSCGAALFNMRLAVLAEGWQAVVDVASQPDERLHIATVRLGRAEVPAPEIMTLYQAIPHRRTNRRPFSPERPSPNAMTRLSLAAGSEGAQAVVLGGSTAFAVADVVVAADRELRGNPTVRKEVARWIHNDATRRDGINLEALGPAPRTERAMVRDFAMGTPMESRTDSEFEQNPTLVLLSTPDDTYADWIAAGQALERMQLTATAQGLATSFLAQPLETDLRTALRSTTVTAGTPQMLLRVGYGPVSSQTPRRPIGELIRAAAPRPRRS